MNKLTYPVVYDTTTAVTRSWNIFDLNGDGVAAPATFVFGPTGHLVAAYIGAHAGDRPRAEDIITVARDFMSGPPPELVTSPRVVPTPTTEPTVAPPPDDTPTAAAGQPSPPDDTPTAGPGQPSPTAAPGATTAPAPDDTPAPAPQPTATSAPASTPSPGSTSTPVPAPTAIPVPTATMAPPVEFKEENADAALGFSLPDAHGGEVNLADYQDEKNVILVFYRAFW